MALMKTMLLVLLIFFVSRVAQSGQSRCESLTDVTEYFWRNDVNRLRSSQFRVNWQSAVSGRNKEDKSRKEFFAYVNKAAFNSKPTFRAFVALLDNYDVFIGSDDYISRKQSQEIDRFYSLIRGTSIFKKLYSHLQCKGYVSSRSDFRSKFYSLWFDLYPRSRSSPYTLDSSGFEHVMVGELQFSRRSKTVSGFHSWIQFYEEERAGRINYYGYVRRVVPNVVGVKFMWRSPQSSRDAIKSLSSFFIGTSPEFDLALYTLCAFEYTNSKCKVRLGGTAYRIQTYDINHKSGLQIGSAYPAI